MACPQTLILLRREKRSKCLHAAGRGRLDVRPHGEEYKFENKELPVKHWVGRTRDIWPARRRQFSFTARSDHMARNINSKTRIYYSNTESEGREIRPHGEKFKLENKEHSFSVACNLSCVVFTTLVFA